MKSSVPDAQPPETVTNECLLFNPLTPIVECFVTAAGAKTAMKSIVIAPNLGRLSPSLPLPHWSRHCLSRTQPQDITGECPHTPVLMWGQVVFPAFFWVCLLESGSVSSPPGLRPSVRGLLFFLFPPKTLLHGASQTCLRYWKATPPVASVRIPGPSSWGDLCRYFPSE